MFVIPHYKQADHKPFYTYLFGFFFLNRQMLALIQLSKRTRGWVLILAPWPSTEILQITSKEHEAVFQTGAHN